MLGSLVAKQVACALFLPGDTFATLVGATRNRSGVGETIPLSAVAVKLGDAPRWLAYGHLGLGQAVVGAAIVVALATMIVASVQAIRHPDRRPLLTRRFGWSVLVLATPCGWALLARDAGVPVGVENLSGAQASGHAQAV